MALRVCCAILLVIGAAAVGYASWRYHKFLRYSRDESYELPTKSRALSYLSQLILIFFLVGYLVGAIYLFTRDVEPIYLFVGFVFFVGGLYISGMLLLHINLTESLRAKTVEVMRTFVNAVEQKDRYTRGHSWHVYHIVKTYHSYLPPALRKTLNKPKLLDAALLHDIGKIGIDERILNKREPLENHEWMAVKTHPAAGKKMLDDTCFRQIGDWVLYHHEHIDGTGYYGLKGFEIPVESKIISIADTYSAITTDRFYRPRRDHEDALTELRLVAGQQLDSELVRSFCAVPARELEALLAKLPELYAFEEEPLEQDRMALK